MTRGARGVVAGGGGSGLPRLSGQGRRAVVEALSPSGRPADNEPSPCSGTENP